MEYKNEDLYIRSTKWQDPDTLAAWSLQDQFHTYCTRTGLSEFTNLKSKTYVGLTREFMSAFQFDFRPKDNHFSVSFKMHEVPICMTLEHFCNALKLTYDGDCCEIRNRENAFWDSKSVDGPRTIHRGKLNTI